MEENPRQRGGSERRELLALTTTGSQIRPEMRRSLTTIAIVLDTCRMHLARTRKFDRPGNA